MPRRAYARVLRAASAAASGKRIRYPSARAARPCPASDAMHRRERFPPLLFLLLPILPECPRPRSRNGRCAFPATSLAWKKYISFGFRLTHNVPESLAGSSLFIPEPSDVNLPLSDEALTVLGSYSPASATPSSSYSEHKPKTPPPDLPSLLLDSRIVYIGMPVSTATSHSQVFLLSCCWAQSRSFASRHLPNRCRVYQLNTDTIRLFYVANIASSFCLAGACCHGADRF